MTSHVFATPVSGTNTNGEKTNQCEQMLTEKYKLNNKIMEFHEI